MKKLARLLLVLVVLAGLVLLAYRVSCRPTVSRACDKLAEQCGGKQAQVSGEQCEGFFEQLERAAGAEAAQKALRCIDESDNCAGSLGCLVGAGFGAAGQFLDGFKRVMENE